MRFHGTSPRDGVNGGPTLGRYGAGQNVVVARPRSIDELVATARARLERVAPQSLEAERIAGALIVDIRPLEQRQRDGVLPGALVIDRTVLEWRLDPTSDHRVAESTDHDQRIVIVCNEGFSSSLAAATLQDLGLRRAADLIGGFQAWLALQRPA